MLLVPHPELRLLSVLVIRCLCLLLGFPLSRLGGHRSGGLGREGWLSLGSRLGRGLGCGQSGLGLLAIGWLGSGLVLPLLLLDGCTG
jgi:hypothetical protein